MGHTRSILAKCLNAYPHVIKQPRYNNDSVIIIALLMHSMLVTNQTKLPVFYSTMEDPF